MTVAPISLYTKIAHYHLKYGINTPTEITWKRMEYSNGRNGAKENAPYLNNKYIMIFFQ